MQKIITSFVAIAAITGAASALEANPYASAKLSVGIQNVKDSTLIDKNGLTPGSNEEDTVIGGKIAAGAKIADIIRTEIEFGFGESVKVNSINQLPQAAGLNVGSTGKTETTTLGLNAYYDIETGTQFTPYVGAGLGWGHSHSTITGYNMANAGLTDSDVGGKFSDDNLIWNVGAGVSYALNDKASIDLSYRYTDLGKLKGAGYVSGSDFAEFSSKTTSHEMLLGARYAF
jgi:opacity protein-like surface antigen